MFVIVGMGVNPGCLTGGLHRDVYRHADISRNDKLHDEQINVVDNGQDMALTVV